MPPAVPRHDKKVLTTKLWWEARDSRTARRQSLQWVQSADLCAKVNGMAWISRTQYAPRPAQRNASRLTNEKKLTVPSCCVQYSCEQRKRRRDFFVDFFFCFFPTFLTAFSFSPRHFFCEKNWWIGMLWKSELRLCCRRKVWIGRNATGAAFRVWFRWFPSVQALLPETRSDVRDWVNGARCRARTRATSRALQHRCSHAFEKDAEHLANGDCVRILWTLVEYVVRDGSCLIFSLLHDVYGENAWEVSAKLKSQILDNVYYRFQFAKTSGSCETSSRI